MYRWRSICQQRAIETLNPASPESLYRLGHLEFFHYGGVAETVRIGLSLDLSDSDRVLDAGCGVGGSARVFADRFGATVVGIDTSVSFVDAAVAVTERVGLTSCTYVVQNMEHRSTSGDVYDVWVASLSLLHTDVRKSLEVANSILSSDGRWAIDTLEVDEPVSAHLRAGRCSFAEVENELGDNEFVVSDTRDQSAEWSAWAVRRALDFDSRLAEFRERYGAQVADERAIFYRQVAEMFESGRIRGRSWIGGRVQTTVDVSWRTTPEPTSPTIED